MQTPVHITCIFWATLLFILVSCTSAQTTPQPLVPQSNTTMVDGGILPLQKNPVQTESISTQEILPTIQAPTKTSIHKYTSFVYQLKNARFEKLTSIPADLLIVDADDTRFSTKELESLRATKTVLAYLSIGEAEEQRDYWRSQWTPRDPPWLYTEHPEKPSRYRVRFWDLAWQTIVQQRLAELLVRGYSGVYVDGVESFTFWEYKQETEARQLMISTIKNLAIIAHKIRTDALIFVHNGEELLSDSTYVESIDGIGKEKVWYDENLKVPAHETQQIITTLMPAIVANKTVLIIDYPTERKKRCEVMKLAREHDYLGYTPTRELDRVVNENC